MVIYVRHEDVSQQPQLHCLYQGKVLFARTNNEKNNGKKQIIHMSAEPILKWAGGKKATTEQASSTSAGIYRQNILSRLSEEVQ